MNKFHQLMDFLKMQLVRLDMLQFIIYSLVIYLSAALLPPLISVVVLVIVFALYCVVGDVD